MPPIAASHHATVDPHPPTASGSWRLTGGVWMNAAAEKLRSHQGAARFVFASLALVLEGFSLGMMRRNDIGEMVRQTYASRPGFYDPRHYHLPHEEQLLPVLSRYQASGRLLDAFCGQGREAELFARCGYEVTGVDELDWMIEAASQYADEAGFEATFINRGFAHFEPENCFDVVYTSCWMYSTMQGSQQRRDFLDHCLRLCNDQAIAVVSYVSQHASSKTGAWLRLAIAKLAALITAGNFSTELGERIYMGLFWIHLQDATVRREVESRGWRIQETLQGVGMSPTFLILAASDKQVGQ